MRIIYLSGKQMKEWAGQNGYASRSKEARYKLPSGHEVKKDVILIDRSMSKKKQKKTIIHEREEVRQMKRGLSYPEAHSLANKKERGYK